MVGVPSIQRAWGAGLLVAALLTAVPGAAAAAEGDPLVLADAALASVTADVDGDGRREVILIRRHPDEEQRLVVEAWGMVAGAWRSLGSPTLERWDDEAGAPRPARFGSDGYGLLSVIDGARVRVIVAVIGGPPDPDTGLGCCLSLATLVVDGGGIRLDLVEASLGAAESLMAVDLEGDGRDELLAAATIGYLEGGPPEMHYALLRRDGDGFARQPVSLGGRGPMYFSHVGDTDGEPGDDLVFADEGGQVVRVVVEQDEIVVESAPGDAFNVGLGQGWPVGAADGVIGWVGERKIWTLRWPRGGAPEILTERTTPSYPSVYLLDDGAHVRWVQFGGELIRPDDLAINVYDEDLELERSVEVPDFTRRLWEINGRGPFAASAPERSLWEYIGPVPGGLGPDRPAILGYGHVIEIGGEGDIVVGPAAHLVGVGAVGVAGDDDGWLAVAGEWWGSGRYAYLANVGYEPSHAMVGVIPLSAVLATPEGSAPAEVRGAAILGEGPDERLVTSGDPFEVTVGGAPGDLVVAYDGRRTVVEEITVDTATLTIDPPGREGRNHEFELSIFVLGPTGLASGITWPAEALRVGPEVQAAAEMQPFALQATITGQATPNATLTVDGRPVVPSPSGAFRLQVDAPAWPRDVLVVARDPLGNETTQRLEVIGFVDYRGLPWIPIVGTLTVAAGIVLFVRTPRLRPEARLRPDGDGRLEEIDGDLL